MGKQDNKVAAVERQRQALELRKAGASYRTIAATLGYAGPQGAYKAVTAGLKEALREPATELKDMECARLDALLFALWPQATKGDPAAVSRCLAVMERRARLLGLDEPRKTELTGADGSPLLPASVDDLAARFDELVRAQAARLGKG